MVFYLSDNDSSFVFAFSATTVLAQAFEIYSAAEDVEFFFEVSRQGDIVETWIVKVNDSFAFDTFEMLVFFDICVESSCIS